MAKLIYDPVTLIKEFIKLVREQGIVLPDNVISEICKYQFVAVRKEMEAGSLQTIRIKYLGSFQVFRGRVIGIKNKMKRLNANGKVKQETADRVIDMCDDYLMNCEDEDTELSDDDSEEEIHMSRCG